MKASLLIRMTLWTGVIISSSAQAELTIDDLALEVAHCYVGHERAQTTIYKSGQAEELKPVIAYLASKNDVNKTILIAKRIQTGTGAMLFMRADKAVKKYCSQIDEKMALALN